ncbi:MAG: O-antigen ligase family protein, partial [Endomicrobiaceae bacterium]|nr:O-antigen ligase family protein [Endomicrobiaceae bacterium]
MENIPLILNYLFGTGIIFTHITGYILSFASLLFVYKNWKYLKKEKIFISMSLFLIYGFVLACFAGDKTSAFSEMFNYFASWLPPFVLGYYITDKVSKYKILLTYITVFTIVAILSVLAYYGLFYKTIFNGHFAGEGLYGHVNAFIWHISLGAMCVLISSVSLIFLLFKEDLTYKQKALLSIFTVFWIMVLFLTGSRGYYIAGFITYCSIFIFYVYKFKKIKIPFVIVSISIILAGIIYFTDPYMQQRIKNTSLDSEDSVTYRLDAYPIAFEIFKRTPLFGVGPRQSTIQHEFKNSNLVASRHLHNLYLNIIADFGLIGFTIFCYLIFQILKRLYDVYMQKNSLFALAMIFAWMSLLLGENFDVILRGPRVAMDYFWLTGLILGG